MIKRHKRNLGSTVMSVFLTAIFMTGCNANSPKPVTDIDGNSYVTVNVGGHLWMAENLNVTRYRNGDPIPEVTDGATWATQNAGARCVYDNKAENGKTFGMLYNWHAVTDPRSLAPAGWHVATDKEWQELAEALGGEESAGNALKAPGKWSESSVDKAKSSGFDALPSGARRDADGVFLMLGQFARVYTSSPASNGKVLARALSFFDNALRGGEVGPRNGFAVRCVKD
jgi:uncharacterized protein (TIGR02145 family)